MKVRIFEVGLRDGLQNESRSVSFDQKLDFFRGLKKSGLSDIEVGAFVRPDRVPQMADTDALFQNSEIRKYLKSSSAPYSIPRIWGLVPNLKGLERALDLGLSNIALFTAASETFNQKNIGMGISDSLKVMKEIRSHARGKKINFRIYVSTVFVCPFEGAIPAKNVLRLCEKLLELKPSEISLGDTVGAGTPRNVTELIRPALKLLGAKKTAVHFHDTRGTALANTLRALDLGVRTVDASAGGLGGCPFAPGATGNLATEDLVFMLQGMGVETGVNLTQLAESSLSFCRAINRPLSSRYLTAYASSRNNQKEIT